MKRRSYTTLLILVGFGIIQSNCEKAGPTSIDVETYIKLLKTNQYDSLDLPAFSHDNIPALLEYRNEKQIISNFPHNPISSLYAPDCSLGMYVLWTIESIRAVSVDSKYLILRFPSQNPILSLRESNELELVHNQESQNIAAQAYYDWWYTNQSWDQLKIIDPLEGTEYKWN